MQNNEIDFCVDIDLKKIDNVILPDGRTLRFEFREGGAEINKSQSIATLDADKVGESLKVRLWRQGDNFVPFGMKGKKLLSDYMTDRKFDITKKRNQCVVCNDCALIWVVGERSDDRYRVSNETIRQLVISVN
jgi:tRNA(Ile)-lysidine synthetase-like protein